MTDTIVMHDVRPLPISMVKTAPWNANKVSKRMLDKIRRSLRTFGAVENLVVRPSWCCGARTPEELEARRLDTGFDIEDTYECLSGNHRYTLYVEHGVETVNCAVVCLTDPHARLLAQALNRQGGSDDPDKLKDLLLDVLKVERPADVAALLPHTENDLLKLLRGDADDATPEVAEGAAVSVPGTVYELGPHRVLCGSSLDRAAVRELLSTVRPILLATDPPYGVSLDQGWRDRVGGMERAAPGTAQSDRIAGDDGFDWKVALEAVTCDVAYLWHAGKHDREARAALEAHGYEIRQQIIWRKKMHVIGRAFYHWQHEPCFFASRTGLSKVPWYGGRNQTTMWDAPSPRQIMGRGAQGGDDAPLGHPTQKPVKLFEIPIVNHLRVGEVVYDPFLGSGAALIAAAKNDRICYGVELEPKFVDLVRRRWTAWARMNGRDPGTGALD
jgi:DNA modification methylase